MYTASGSLFNCESPHRGYEFATRKITSGIARIAAGRERNLRLGNLEAKRDRGHAREYTAAVWKTLRQPEADDYVIGTGETKLGWEHKVPFPQLAREMVEADCKLLGVEAQLNRVVGGQV